MDTPKRTMHDFLKDVAQYIVQNLSTEQIEALDPDIISRIAVVLENRHNGGWSLEADFHNPRCF